MHKVIYLIYGEFMIGLITLIKQELLGVSLRAAWNFGKGGRMVF
jgi:hypothetical protein